LVLYHPVESEQMLMIARLPRRIRRHKPRSCLLSYSGAVVFVYPDSQATCLPSGRNSTYRPVQIFRGQLFTPWLGLPWNTGTYDTPFAFGSSQNGLEALKCPGRS
jgi:hypothetical protein